MSQQDIPQVINFLRQDLSLSDPSIELALKKTQANYGSLPMVLWEYGFVSLQQLDTIYDWFESYLY